MAKNHVAEGERLILSNPGVAIVSGQAVVLASSMLAVAMTDIAATGSGAVAIEGAYELPKATGPISIGERLYWDEDGNPIGGVAGSGAITTTATGNVPAGVAYSAALTGAATAVVVLGAPWATVATTAAAVAVVDSASHFTGSNTETVLAEIAVSLKTAQATIPIPLGAITMADGTALTKQATTVAGLAQLSSKEQAILIPVGCTSGESLAFSVPLPQDIDTAAALAVHVLAGKDADNDALTLDCEVYPVGAADGGNADIQDTAAQAVSQAIGELVFSCGADGLLASPSAITAVLALGGTNDGDAVHIYGAWVEYTRKIMTA